MSYSLDTWLFQPFIPYVHERICNGHILLLKAGPQMDGFYGHAAPLHERIYNGHILVSAFYPICPHERIYNGHILLLQAGPQMVGFYRVSQKEVPPTFEKSF